MATSVNKCVIIGLGGTGQRILLELKLKLQRDLGEIPPMIRFLVLDTDKREDARQSVVTEPGEESKTITATFTEEEYLHMKTENTLDFIKRNYIKTWLTDDLRTSISDCSRGAGQRRYLGRVSFYFNYAKVLAKIKKATADVRDPSVNNDRFNIASPENIDYHIVFSIAGGTGAGTFIDIAAVIKSQPEYDSNTKVFGYAIGPDIYKGKPYTNNVTPNAYGSLMDLDYLMNKNNYNDDTDKRRWKFKYTEQENLPEISLKYILYDNFVIFENSSPINTISSLNDLEILVANSMYCTISGPHKMISSTFDNAKSSIREDIVEDKPVVYTGMGYGQLNYDRNFIFETFNMNYMVKLIDYILRNGTSDDMKMDTIIEDFVKKTGIKEDEKTDLLIDMLYDLKNKKAKYAFTPEKGGDEKWGEVLLLSYEKHRSVITKIKDEIDENYRKKISDVKKEINKDIADMLGKEGGISNSIMFSSMLRGRLETMKKEIEAEIDEHLKKADESFSETNKKLYLTSLTEQEASFKSFFSNSAIVDAKDQFIQFINDLILNEIEKHRKHAASIIYQALSTHIDDAKIKINDLKSTIEHLQHNVVSKLAENKSMSAKSNGVVIPLHIYYLRYFGKIEETEINKLPSSISKCFFSKYVVGEGDPLATEKIDELSLRRLITNELKSSFKTDFDKHIKKTAQDVLIDIYDKDHEVHKSIVKSFDYNSEPLWRINDMFDKKDTENKPEDMFIISANEEKKEKEKTKLEKEGKYLTDHLRTTKNPPAFFKNLDDSKIEIYRLKSPAPLFSIYHTNSWYIDYKKSKDKHHVDMSMLKNIQLLDPNIVNQEDDTIKPWAIANAIGLSKKMLENQEYVDLFNYDDIFINDLIAFPYIIRDDKYKIKIIKDKDFTKYASADGFKILFDPESRANNRKLCADYFYNKKDLCGLIVKKYKELKNKPLNQESLYKVFINFIIFHLIPLNTGKQIASLSDNEKILLQSEITLIKDLCLTDFGRTPESYMHDFNKTIKEYEALGKIKRTDIPDYVN